MRAYQGYANQEFIPVAGIMRLGKYQIAPSF